MAQYVVMVLWSKVKSVTVEEEIMDHASMMIHVAIVLAALYQ